MAKPEDWNDKSKKDPSAAKAEFDALEAEATGSTISVLADYDPSIKVMNDMNEAHTFIKSIGGKSFVTYKIWNEVTEREELEFLPLDTFKNMYLNQTISEKGASGKGSSITYANFWISESRRSTVDSVIFDPSTNNRIVERGGKKYLNLWEGFSVVPAKGSWRYTKRHIYRILCNSDHVKFKYVIKWLAWMVQNPDRQAEVALVFKGEMGAGKGFLFTQFKKIFGAHGMAISNPNRLTGRFNSHFRSLCFLFCDEVYYPGNKEVEGAIKAMVTEEYIDSESKHKDPIAIRNRLHIAMATNNEWVIPAGPNERRYFVEKVCSMYAKNRATEPKRKAYFTKIWREMDNGGREAMLYDLLNYNLGEWHPRNEVPETTELRKQKELSLDPVNSALLSILEEGNFPGEVIRGCYYVSSEALYALIEKIEPKSSRFSSNRKAEYLKVLGISKSRMAKTGRIRWEFPELFEIRKIWNNVNLPIAWDDLKTWRIDKSDF